MTVTPADPATWPVLLTAQDIAAIFRRSVMGIKKACQRGRFVPAPCQVRPYLWRRADVVRFVEGARGFSSQQLRKVAS